MAGGAVNGAVFRAYAEQVLAPALRPGDEVVMDNLSSRKVAGVREAVERAKARVSYLPAYSPDCNPIELAFAKVKARPRALELRDVAGLEGLFGRAHSELPAGECAAYIRHCGYAATDLQEALSPGLRTWRRQGEPRAISKLNLDNSLDDRGGSRSWRKATPAAE